MRSLTFHQALANKSLHLTAASLPAVARSGAGERQRWTDQRRPYGREAQ